MSQLLDGELKVLNLGLSSFADDISAAGGSAANINWTPPAKGDREIGLQLADLINNPIVDRANEVAFNRYLDANPVLIGVGTVGKDLPGIGERTLLHAGPPVPWESMCGPMRGGVIGAILYEGWADTEEKARQLAAGGEITFDSCHHHNAVGPMAGLMSPSMPVWIVENTEHGNKTYSTLNEGLGKVLRYGAYSPEVITRLKLIETKLAPVLTEAVENGGQIELKPFLAQALHMGDECHNRNVAGSSLLVKKLVPSALRTNVGQEDVAAVVDYIADNDVFFLNISMAACKAMMDAAHDVPGSSMVTAMARNGVNFGMRVSGTGGQWFETPAPLVEGLYFPGYSIADAGADMGDSAITETAGLGGFAMAAAIAIVLFIGGTPAQALAASREMRKITLGVNSAFTLPGLDFAATAAGIDIRRVVDTSIQPVVNTGIAHKEAGIGQIGAGITEAPNECFTQAISALHRVVSDMDGSGSG